MSFGLKLLIFWLCIFTIYFYIARYPQSFAAKLLLSWQSPQPKITETKAHFLLRYAVWAFRWFSQLVVVEAAGIYVLGIMGKEHHTLTLVIFAFVLPILAGVALFSSVLLLIGVFLNRVFRKRMIFRVPPPGILSRK